MSKVRSDNISNRADTGAPKLTFGAEVPVGYGITGAGGINITGIVTAASASFTGNVSVGGTLTYEDVTNVDSVGLITARKGIVSSGVVTATTAHLDAGSGDTILQVEGGTNGDGTLALAGTGTGISKISFWDQLAFGKTAGGVGDINTENLRIDSAGRVGVGTTAPVTTAALNVAGTTDIGAAGRIALKRRDTSPSGSGTLGELAFTDSGTTIAASIRGRRNSGTWTSGTSQPTMLTFHTTVDGANTVSERLRITSTGGVHFSNAELIERVNIVANKVSAAPNINLDDGMVHYFTTAESTTSTPNIRSSVGLNTAMAVGDTSSVTIITTAAAAGYATTINIDGVITGAVRWVGGSAPSSGGSSGLDIYSYQIIKTANLTFTVIGNLTNAA